MGKKLVVQIPAYNEKDDIGRVIRRIPRSIDGIDAIEVVVIDDGSTDNTLEVVKQAGVKHVIRFEQNRGLGEAFKAGMAYALDLGADIIVNMDADAQYCEADIAALVEPLLTGQADASIGDRRLSKIEQYPRYKLAAQSAGNRLAGKYFRMHVPDATSGFRAFSRRSARLLQETLKNRYTYTIESLGILSRSGLSIVFVPVSIRYPTRPTRLIKSRAYYVFNFISTVFRCAFQETSRC